MGNTAARVGGSAIVALGAAAVFVTQLMNAPKCTDRDVVCLRWSAPTQWTDNKPITTPVTYRVYRGKGLLPKTSVANVTDKAELMLTAQPSGMQCFQLTARVKNPTGTNMLESDRSGEVCKAILLPAPSDGSIVAPTDGSVVDH